MPRDYIDMDFIEQVTIEKVMDTHRRRRHMIEVLNHIEGKI